MVVKYVIWLRGVVMGEFLLYNQTSCGAYFTSRYYFLILFYYNPHFLVHLYTELRDICESRYFN